jgi:protein-disulfide isomerase
MRGVTDMLRRSVKVTLWLLAAVIVSACAEGDAGEGDGDGARLTTRGAGELLTSGQTPETTPSQMSLGDVGEVLPPPGGQDVLNVDSLGFDRGSLDAPVRVLEFSDFGCGYCRKFHLETLPTLVSEYMDEGTVLWKQIAFVMGNWANSVPASLAAECALDQGKFDAMSHALYERQSDWKGSGDVDAVLRRIAESVDLDMDPFDTCMADDALMWRVQAHTALARQVGVRATPTFFVVGYAPLQGALPLDLFRQILDTVLVAEGAGRR